VNRIVRKYSRGSYHKSLRMDAASSELGGLPLDPAKIEEKVTETVHMMLEAAIKLGSSVSPSFARTYPKLHPTHLAPFSLSPNSSLEHTLLHHLPTYLPTYLLKSSKQIPSKREQKLTAKPATFTPNTALSSRKEHSPLLLVDDLGPGHRRRPLRTGHARQSTQSISAVE